MTGTKKKAKSNNYFTEETELNIVLYNNTEDSIQRNKIFTDHIYSPFYKLAESIIHRYKFYYTEDDNLEDLKHEVVTMLLEEKIAGFDPTKGFKAYSYFGTITKRWLIHYNDRNFKRSKRLDNIDGYEIESDEFDHHNSVAAESKVALSYVFEEFIDSCYSKMDLLFEKEQERKVADAVLTVFKNRNDLNIFKKKAIYIYIREITGIDTVYLTSVISVLKKEFYIIYQGYIENDITITTL